MRWMSLSSSAKSQLFVYLVDQLLKSQVYAAKEVGYYYSLSASPHGLTLSFSGLSDPVTFGKLISSVTNGECLIPASTPVLYHCVFETYIPSSHPHIPTVFSHVSVHSGTDVLYSLAKHNEMDYLMNYNVTAIPYQYYHYIQS